MDEPFDVNADPARGIVLTRPGDTPPTPEDVGILPDVSQVLGPAPQLPLPPPPPPPPRPSDDPRQQLAALIALGTAIGLGPRGGGGAALHGFAQTQRALQQDAETRHQRAVQENLRQQTIVGAQQRAAETDYRQRQQNLQSALVNFKAKAAQAQSKAEYDQLAEAYGNILGQQYRTITPNWLRSNIPYMAPSESKLASDAFDSWLKNPSNKRLLDEQPQLALQSTVSVDLNGDGVKENVPLPVLAEKAGKGFAATGTGPVAVPRTPGGTSAFDVKYRALVDQFRAENRRDPNPKENNAIVDQAILASKEKPIAEEDASVALSPQGLDAAALMYAKTGQLPPMGMSRQSAGIRSKIINRAAALYGGEGAPLDVASNRAGFESDKSSLQKLQQQRDAVNAFERTAGANLDRFLGVAKNVVDSGSPWVNRPYRAIRRTLLGDPSLAQFDAARLAAQNEISRVLNTANLSGQLTDNARREMEAALSPEATFAQLYGAAQILKQDMATRKKSYDDQIAEIRGRIKSKPGQSPTSTDTTETPGASPALQSARDKLRNR